MARVARGVHPPLLASLTHLLLLTLFKFLLLEILERLLIYSLRTSQANEHKYIKANNGDKLK